MDNYVGVLSFFCDFLVYSLHSDVKRVEEICMQITVFRNKNPYGSVTDFSIEQLALMSPVTSGLKSRKVLCIRN